MIALSHLQKLRDPAARIAQLDDAELARLIGELRGHDVTIILGLCELETTERWLAERAEQS